MDSEEYKHRGGEKAVKVKNKRYTRTKKIGVNARTGSYMKSKGSNAMRMSYMSRLNNPNEWDEFQMPVIRRSKSHNYYQICGCCRHGVKRQKFY